MAPRRTEAGDGGVTFGAVATAAPRFDDFFRAEHSRLVALAAAVSGNRVFAEDLAQEAMVQAADRWDEVSGYDNPGAWVRRVVVNMAISRRRRFAAEARARLRLVANVDTVALPPALPADQKIWDAVAELPDQQRAAIALHYLEGHDAASIASILDCSPSTARVHLHRGRHALAARLDPQEV